MSYCPSSSPSKPDCFPGLTSLLDGRRSSINRNTQNLNISDSLNDFPFDSNWNLIIPKGKTPEYKAGQSIIYWPDQKSIICGYGKCSNDSFSTEFWKFIIHKGEWEFMDIKDLNPKAGCGHALIENKLFFFGGFNSNSFLRELHYIDLLTNEVTYPITTGDIPPPCALPLVAYYSPYLIVWAGTSGTNLCSLHILNTEEMDWKKIKTDFVGRQGACGGIIGTNFYIYGASCPMSIICLDLIDFHFSLIVTTGTEPPHGLECLTIVTVGDCLVAFETIGTKSKSKIYIFDPERSHWINFTTNDESNNLILPKIVFYLPNERKLFALCECNSTINQPFTELSIGKSIANLNQRLDLLSMLQKF